MYRASTSAHIVLFMATPTVAVFLIPSPSLDLPTAIRAPYIDHRLAFASKNRQSVSAASNAVSASNVRRAKPNR